MATAQLQLPVEEITARAREVKFTRVALTLFLGFFWVIGWALGHAWTGVVMMVITVRRGWRDAQGLAEVPQPRRKA
jgi:hypothetical protein